MNSARDSTSRLRANLNPLRTSALGGVFHGQNSTPLSAVSMVSQTPVSAIQPYNPQEWAPSPAPHDRPQHHYQELSPQQSPPPPPYSPPRSQRPVSMVYETSPANISATRSPLPAAQQRPSPEPSVHQTFAPPPGSTRGGSRDRRFGLPSFGRRRDPEQQHNITISPSDLHAAPQQVSIPPPPASRSPQPQLQASANAANTSSPGVARRQQQPVLQPLQIPDNQTPAANNNGQVVPPGSRRAASTGAIGTPTSARSRSASQVRWDQGVPLPPPPPGPPPASSRSQSMNRPSSGSDPVVSPPTRRPPPAGVTSLGPVPPTPAGWFDQDAHTPQDSNATPRQIPDGVAAAAASEDHSLNRVSLVESTSSAASSRDHAESAVSSNSTADSHSPNMTNTLARTGAVRGEKTLRERRNESRTRNSSVRNSIDGSVEGGGRQLSNIVIPTPGTVGSLVRRPTINRSTPRSGGGGPNSGRLALRDTSPQTGDTATPPFSPHPIKSRPHPISTSAAGTPQHGGSETHVPKALPTPPLQSRSASTSQTRHSSDTVPASAAPPSPSFVSKEMARRQTAEQFSQGTIERFNVFAHKETLADSDAERVRLFAEFIVSESRIRRERYAGAIGAMGSEIFDLTRDLFRPMAIRRESMASQGSASAGASAVEFTPQSSEPSRSHRGSIASVFHEGPSSAPPVSSTAYSNLGYDKAPVSAGVESTGSSGSAVMPMSPTGPPPNGWQQSNYMPSLSPILSMSVVSEHHEDGSSRGRTASRWWESSSHGGDGTGRLERSKRESKYMGVPKEAREALQWTDNPEPLSGKSVVMAGDGSGYGNDPGVGSSSAAVDYSAYESSSEYPPEKVAYQSTPLVSPEPTRTPQAPSQFRNSLMSSAASTPSTPNAALLDVSRLVTLPPPYPRHHPAVNNNHPELTAIRSAVRTLSDMTEVDAAQERFARESQAAGEEAAKASQQQKQAMRANLQAEIGAGRMSYAEAAAIEADAAETDKAQQKEREKAEFDRFQTTVVMPVNELLTGRIGKATQLFDELRGRLFVETREPSPNMPQEEGDEQPELLEQLTLLKWIFEAREALHRAIYDLLSDRNNRYRDMVLTPYRLSGNQEKLQGAEAFFADDAAKRAQAFADEALQRTQEFRDVVEENVVRGVEVQLSAFWDIAPPLAQLLDQIPDADHLRGFRVRVPAGELAETPSYREHPLQYLFSLLLHAEKSTHQFIESQTNLLCLLHEVKELAVAAKARVLGHEGRDGAAATAEERARLTEDLQDKVRVVQDQWRAGLGESIVLVKERVGGWLLETGGWDESLEDGGVGSV